MEQSLLKLFKEAKIDFTNAYIIPESGGDYFTEDVYEISPKSFLRFAKMDLLQNDERGLINSLTNSKRAIDCQIDFVFSTYRLNKWDSSNNYECFINEFEFKKDIPIKLKIIQALNLAPALLISKTRTLRNRLEHLYQKPSEKEVFEALDVAEMFIRSIEAKVKLPVQKFSLTDYKKRYEKNNRQFGNCLLFSFLPKKEQFLIEKIVNSKTEEKLKVKSSKVEYLALLRLMNSIDDDDFEIEHSIKIILKLVHHPVPVENVCVYQG